MRYRGRVDDQFGFGIHRPAPTRRDLATALDELLAGHPVTTPRTESVGCRIGRIAKTKKSGDVTYSQQVARILRDRCVACHREGEIAPFSLANFAQAAGWAEMIDEVVQGGRMPPWHASPEYGSFSNEARLSAEEKQTIAAWVAGGAPEGDPHNLPEPTHYVKGLAHPRPRPGHRLAQDRQDPRRGHDALSELHGRPQAQEGRLGEGVSGASGQSVGGPPPGRFRDPAGEPLGGEDRFPGGLRAGMPPRNLARGDGPARPGRFPADVSGALHPARDRRRRIAARSAWSSPIPRRSARR